MLKVYAKSAQSTIGEAKKRLLANVGTNVILLIVNVAIGVGLTPYFIKHLGIEVYGMIPLVISFIAYFNLFTMSISSTVSRFVAICIGKGEAEKSNVYFNSALVALLALSGIFFIPVSIVSVFFSRIFQVPAGFETDAGWLFFYVMFSTFILAVNSPFIVSTFVTHRFDLNNAVQISGKCFRVIIIVASFAFLSPSLKYVGLSYCGLGVFCLVSFVMLTRRLTPQLQVNFKRFSWSEFREMGHMSGWIVVNQIGALLYLSISFVIINIFLGPEQVGRYGPVAQWIPLLGMLGWTISNVLTPIAYDYIAHSKMDTLAIQMRRFTKFMGLIIGFTVGLMCGLSTPLLHRWLGSAFSDLGPLVWLLIGPWLVNIIARPMLSIFMGLNKMKVPAIVTIIGGAVNVLMSILLVRYTSLGIYGVAFSLSICLAGKNLFFTPVYAAVIISRGKTIFLKEIVRAIVIAAGVSLAALAISRMYDLATIPRLMAVGALMAAVYVPLCYFIIMDKQERALLWSLIVRQK